MKIDVYCTMRNEEKLLPYFLRHYGSFADRIFVWEDESTDRTREILKAHPKVVILDMNFHGIDDTYFVKKLFPQYQILSRGGADWVMCVDADEFIYHPNLRNALSEFKERGIQAVRCHGFSMISDTFPTTQGQIYEEVFKGIPDEVSSKDVVFSPEIHVMFFPGRHSRSRARTLEGKAAVKELNGGFNLLHFRYLGEEYFIERNRYNWERRGFKYSIRQKSRMPDGKRAVAIKWYVENKDRAVRVV